MTKIIKYDEREELIQKVAAKISSALITALDGRETITFAVPGGTTPGPILEKLSEFYLDWARVNVILGDEMGSSFSRKIKYQIDNEDTFQE